MARADLILKLVKAGSESDQDMFRKSLEALVSEERAKQHHVLAERLEKYLKPENQGTITRLPSRERRLHSDGSGLFDVVHPERTLDDLVLADHVQASCQRIIEEHHRADLLRASNVEPRHKILLNGPPGNGKTSLAEAFANEIAVPMFVVRYDALIGSYLGETTRRIHEVFNEVANHHCVLFFDEFDVLGKERDDRQETGEMKRVVSSLLLQIDRLPSHVIAVAATNHRSMLDRAVWRRFELHLELGRPSAAARRRWLEGFERRSGTAFEHTYEYLTKRLAALSFAEIEQFALDVQRTVILAESTRSVREITTETLKQWSDRLETVRDRRG